jgi:hypothetical protein
MLPEPDPYKYAWSDQACAVRDVRLALSPWGRALTAWYGGSLRGMAMAVYLRAPRPVQMAVRRLVR